MKESWLENISSKCLRKGGALKFMQSGFAGDTRILFICIYIAKGLHDIFLKGIRFVGLTPLQLFYNSIFI